MNHEQALEGPALASSRAPRAAAGRHGRGSPPLGGRQLDLEQVRRNRVRFTPQHGNVGPLSRRNNLDRCPTCSMHETLCICALVPQLAARTRLELIVHCREEGKPTNTGQLAARCLERSHIAIVGDRERPLELAPVAADEQAIVLFPADDAVPIAQFADRPIVLIVPDGNWRQASKMRKRVPGLAALPCVTLPDTGPSTYRLRAEVHEGGLATFEAIARALCILEGKAGPAIEAAMLAVFHVMVERTLWLRGALPDHAVTGGIPAAAIERNPRSTRATRS